MTSEGWGGLKIAILALPLAACATKPIERPQPIIVTKEVVVPGPPSPCVPANVGPRPVYPDTDAALKAAADAAVRYQLMAAGRKLKDARLNEIEPVIASCPKAK